MAACASETRWNCVVFDPPEFIHAAARWGTYALAVAGGLTAAAIALRAPDTSPLASRASDCMKRNATDDGLIRQSNRRRPLDKYVRDCEHEFSPKLQIKVMPRYVSGVKAAVCAKNCLKAVSGLGVVSLIQPGV